MLTIYSQRNPKWVNKIMKPSKLTLGRYGCTTTSIAMAGSYFGEKLTPADVCEKIKYTPDGLIIWSTCEFKKFKFVVREYGRKDQNIIAGLNDPNMIVLLQVADGSHWVLCTGKYGKDYRIADPWDGVRKLSSVYQNITGASYFERK